MLAEWSTLLPTIIRLINSKRSETRLGYTPNELFLGQDYKDSLMENDAKRRHVTYLGDGVIKPKKPERIDHYLEQVRKQMMLKRDKVYRYVLTKRVTQRQRNRLHTLQYQEGDYVMVSNANTKRERNKTKPKWTGPYEVVRVVSNNVYEVESLLGKRRVIHANFMWFYEPEGYVPTEAMRNVFLQDQGELEVETILNWKQNEEGFFLLVKWLGFEESQNSWEPMDHLFDYLPDLIIKYGKATKSKKLSAKIKELELANIPRRH